MDNSLFINALEKAIKIHGIRVLNTPQLANILSDYGAFDIYDNDRVQKKEIITSIVSLGYGEKIIRWKRRRKYDWRRENDHFVEKFKKKHSFDERMVDDIFSSFVQTIGLPEPRNKKTNSRRSALFNITLSKSDKLSIVVGFILLAIATLCGLQDDGDGAVQFIGLLIPFVQFFFLLWISKCGSNSPSFKYNGTGVSYAFMIGELIIPLLLILFPNAYYDEPPFVIYATTALAIMALSIIVGIRAKQVQLKLFLVTLSGVMLIILILTIMPLVLKQTYIYKHNSRCERSIAIREKHLKENPKLGFMGIPIGDSYLNLKKMLSRDSNVVRIVSDDKIISDNIMVDWFDASSYFDQHWVTIYERPLSLNRIVKYDVYFNGDTTRVTLGFIADTIKIIEFYNRDISVYKDKYGEPEVYYNREAKECISFGNSYPYYEYLGSLPYPIDVILQWSFQNGVIRSKWNATSYISNDILDSIGVTIQEEQRIEQEKEKEIRDSIEQERRLSIILKEEDEREEFERQEKERIVKEKARKEALQQI